jgi:hypothetical protein
LRLLSVLAGEYSAGPWKSSPNYSEICWPSSIIVIHGYLSGQ